MRLNQMDKDTIIKRALTSAFGAKEDKHQKAGQTLGLKLYKAAFKAKDRDAASALPLKWIRRTSKFEFNVNGPCFEFTLTEALPAYHDRYERPAVASDELKAECEAHFEAGKQLKTDKELAAKALKILFSNITTLKVLEEQWPQGRPHYKDLKAKTRLPAPQIEEINKLLGIK